jgi:hypothetical protein
MPAAPRSGIRDLRQGTGGRSETEEERGTKPWQKRKGKNGKAASGKAAKAEAAEAKKSKAPKADLSAASPGSAAQAGKVSFLVEKTEKGVRVMVKGQPKTEEVIPLAALKESINKAAYSYTDKHVDPKEKVGNKGGSLSNRLRAVLNA